ncbi:MAG: fibronectin type III domain-containing protein, partial [Elusimicrobia bacterium]|nr:fibronectin type III domain-containing protein [Elusimicrobiota bacterium]
MIVYKVASSGSALVSTATFNEPSYSLNDIPLDSAIDSSGIIWITGIIQTGGDFDSDSGNLTTAMGFWKYNTATGELTNLDRHFGPSNVDGGFGIAINAATGDKWIIGFSSNSATSGAAKLDLALWKYDSAGNKVLATPLLQPGYMKDLEDIDSSIVVNSSGIFVAASRFNGTADNLDLAFLKYDLSGSTQVVSFWHSLSPSRNDAPSGMAADSSGGLYVVGGVFGEENSQTPHELALWKYDSTGTFVFAKTLNGEERGNGIAIGAADVKWLATESTSPVQFVFGSLSDLSGAEGLAAGPTPPVSKVNVPTHNGTAASLITISGTAADDDAVAEVRVSVQRLADGKYYNGSAYDTAETFLLASGTTQWVLVSGQAVNSGTGTFKITSRAKDGDANLQTDFTLGVAQITVTRRLNPPSNFGIPSVSSTTISVTWDANGNPSGTQYHIHYATVASCNEFTPNSLSSSFVTVTAQTLTGLQSNSTYFIELHTVQDNGYDFNEGFIGKYLVTTSPSGQGAQSNPPTTFCGGGGGDGPANGGLAVETDASNYVWQVFAVSGNFGLAKYSPSGFFLSSTSLLYAEGDFGWSIQFGASGEAYAVGMASGPATMGRDVAVYKVSAQGDALLGTKFFNGPENLDDYALGSDTDASGNIWIAGAAQTGGQDENETNALALYKYDLSGNTLARTTTYASIGQKDAGFDIEVGPSEIWVVGFSSNPNTAGANKIDLALWKYDLAGTTLQGVPYRWPGYLNDLDIDAGLVLTPNALFIATAKLNSFDDADLAFIKFSTSGASQFEKFWHGGAGSDEWAQDLELDGDGNLVLAGGYHTGGQSEQLAAWKYDASGNLIYAKTVAGVDFASDLAKGGWMAVGSSTVPYQFSDGAASALSGEEGLAVGQVTAAPFSQVAYDSLRANWTSNLPSGTLYYAWLSTHPSVSPVFSSQSTSNSHADFTGLAEGLLYYGAVSTTSVGAAAYTALGSTRTLMLTPLNAFFSFASPRSLSVAWDSIGNAAYTAVLARDSGFNSVVSTRSLSSNATTYLDLTPQTAYFFKVRLSTDPVFNSAISTSTLPLPPPSFTGDFSRYEGAIYDSGEVDRAAAVAVDSITAGGPYVYTLGSTSGTIAGQQWVIIKYDSQGIKLASAAVQDPGPYSSTYPQSISVDSLGRLYISGYFNNGSARLVQYTSDLAPLKAVDIASAYSHHSEVFETGGNVFVYSARRLGGNIEVVKYDSNLVGIATGTFSGGNVQSFAVGPSGDAYVAWTEYSGGSFVAMLRFDSNLNFVSSAAVTAPLTSIYGNNVIAADGSGNVFITGYGSNYSDALTYKYDSNFNLLASTTALNRGSGNSIAVDRADGSVHVASWGQVLRYNNGLNQLINSSLQGGEGIAVADSSRVYLASTINYPNSDISTRRLDLSAGAVSPARPNVQALRIDAQGNIWQAIFNEDCYSDVCS